jgi:hypothetical protein
LPTAGIGSSWGLFLPGRRFAFPSEYSILYFD